MLFSKKLTRFFLRVATLCVISTGAHGQRPSDIVDVRVVIPDIALDIRYTTRHNFIGRPIPGYRAAKCLLTRNTVEALATVQSQLREFGLGLKVYDCYRPQSAIDYFVTWGRDLDDQMMKAESYPSVDKSDLFRDGYIAERSGHSRASTVDLTIVALPLEVPSEPNPDASLRSCENEQPDRSPDASIDMGTGYDCFSILAHTMNPSISPQQRANRLLLRNLMEANGFASRAENWWHFTLSNERYPDSYFDFPVE